MKLQIYHLKLLLRNQFSHTTSPELSLWCLFEDSSLFAFIYLANIFNILCLFSQLMLVTEATNIVLLLNPFFFFFLKSLFLTLLKFVSIWFLTLLIFSIYFFIFELSLFNFFTISNLVFLSFKNFIIYKFLFQDYIFLIMHANRYITEMKKYQ